MPVNRSQSEPHAMPALNDAQSQQTAKHLARQSKLVKQYYARVPFDEIGHRSPKELSAAAMSHWNMAAKRKTDESLIRIYNPSIKQHGWESQHTIIEITTTDKPFLVRSMSLAISRFGFSISGFIHPVFHVARKKNGQMEGMVSESHKDAVAESFMQLHVDKQYDESKFDQLKQVISEAITNVNLVCDDWEPMKNVCGAAVDRLRATNPNKFEIAEAADFIKWLQRYYFTFTGYAELQTSGKTARVSKALGIFRVDKPLVTLNKYIHKDELLAARKSDVLTITKSAEKAPVMLPVHMDVISFKRIDNKGKESGRCVITGFFTTRAFGAYLDSIPLLRHKSFNIIAKSKINPGAHDGKMLLSTLESLPKDLLLQTDEDTIHKMCRGIMKLEHHPQVRLFGTQDHFNRFATCIVYVPSDLYSRDLRERIQQILQTELKSDNIDFNASFSSENALARLHFFLSIPNPEKRAANFNKIENLIIDAAQNWDENIRETLIGEHGVKHGCDIVLKLLRGVPDGYKNNHSTAVAARDLTLLNQCQSEVLDVLLYRTKEQSETEVSFNMYHSDLEVPLSKTIHILENMGFQVDSENPFVITTNDSSFHIREFQLRSSNGKPIPVAKIAEDFRVAFLKVWSGDIEDDGMNQLVMAAGLNWRQTTIMRSYARYLLQIKIPYSFDYITDCLIGNADLAGNIAQQFETRFNPTLKSTKTDKLQKDFSALLDEVVSLDEDRILRALQSAITATLRTNYFKKDEHDQPITYLSMKLNPCKVEGMPLPCPAFEIFVCSPRFEATHLRGGKVARGGLRWSDRREDFRTEVLGLMKAQMVKNSVIVPVGSKGGFVVKQPPVGGSREELMTEVIYCYQNFLRGLLDITDNYVDGKVVRPSDVVCHDEQDPYLVVAADKGTATFSDIANGISEEYGFWLGDAFASGGSVGYDHKGMGITAKGAWESVKRHFREMEHDTQEQEFTVVGIGDMGGDVFGNGMLLSNKIKLLAAFNHMHIFLDPDPDPAKSFKERERMFKLERSTWEDYNSKLISKGGGVFSRSAKSIKLSPQVQALIGGKAKEMAPNDLIHSLLKARVDLLWNGGIGTYMKASSETHADAQDKANDPLRVDASALRCKVVGEGGNLGCTQLGRIEFTARGGKMYTDAIDNSAGVDCSDHEVNIKILVDSLVNNGKLPAKRRAALLASMTDNVSSLVLRDNYQQTQCISLILAEAPGSLDEHSRFISSLEAEDKLNRDIEFLPDSEEITERIANNKGLTAPEIAVLVAYSKMDIYQRLMDSPFADDPFFEQELLSYFPPQLSKKYPDAIRSHQLRREIIATQTTNSFVNRLGPTYLRRLRDELGAQTSEIATAFVAVRHLFKLRDLWSEIESLDNKITNAAQTEMLLLVRGWVERGVHWLVKNRRSHKGPQDIVDKFGDSVTELRSMIPDSLAKPNKTSYQSRCNHFNKSGAPAALAARVASVVPLSSSFDILDIHNTSGVDLKLITSLYFHLGDFLKLQWLREQIELLEAGSHWHILAKSALRSDIHYRQRHLSAEIIETAGKSKSPEDIVKAWADKSDERLTIYRKRLKELMASKQVDYAMLTLAVNEVQKLLNADRPLAGSD